MTARPGPRASRPRSEAHYGPERGDTYLIHFERPFRHARHYRGWTPRPALQRFADHLAGRGSKLTAEAVKAGIGMKLARVWPDTTRDYEDAIKHQGGAARLCPDCGAPCAPPRLATGTPRPEADREHLSLYELERLGTTSDGTPLPIVTTYPDQAAAQAAAGEENQMFGRGSRAAARAEAEQRAAAWAEADRLAAQADQIDVQAGRQPGQPLPLAAERAAGVRDYIARDLVRDARAAASEPHLSPDEVAARAVELGRERLAGVVPGLLRGADLDSQIDRLAEAFPEAGGPEPAGYTPYPEDVTDPPWAREEAEAWGPQGPAASYAEWLAEGAGPGGRDLAEPGPENWGRWAPGFVLRFREWRERKADAEARERLQAAADEGETEDEYMTRIEAQAAEWEAQDQAERDAAYEADWQAWAADDAAWAARRQGDELDAEPGRLAEAFPEPEIEGPGAEPGPDAAQWSPSLDDPGAQAGEDLAVAAEDHDRALRLGRMAAAQAAMSGSTEERQLEQRAVRLNMSARRAAEREAWIAAAGMQQAAEREPPDHLYGAPECAEPDPETAHFGSASPEAEDRGRWPLPRVLQADEVSPVRAPVAAALPDGTPHVDPYYTGRGWQAQGGIYARAPQAQAEAG